MHAAVYRRYGGPSVVTVEELETPVPGAGEVLVKVTASVVSAADAAMRSGTPFAARLFAGPFRPRLRVLGSEFTGTVAGVGEGVDAFRVGDAVWGITGTGMRAHAEYIVVPADGVLEPLPAGLDPVDAAALIDPTALSFLDDTAELVAGQTILINGASGRSARRRCSWRCTGAPSSPRCAAPSARRSSASSARTRCSTTAPETSSPTLRAQGRTFDVVFDVYGNLGYRRARDLLTPTGRYCGTGADAPDPVAHAVTRAGRAASAE